MGKNNLKLKALAASACAAALCIALVGCGGSASSSAAASDVSSTSGSVSADASSPASASASSESASASSTATSASASARTADPDLVDDLGNVTLYALMESTGPELVDLLRQQDYEWSSASSLWARSVDGASFVAATDNGAFSESGYAAAADKGGCVVAISANVVAGYSDAEAALKGNAHCVIEDSYFDETGSGIAIVYGPSMVEYLVIVQPYSESTCSLDIYSQQAVGTGMLDQVYGQQIGGSFDEVWKNFTGRDMR